MVTSLSGTDYVIPSGPLASGLYTLFTAGSVPASPSNLATSGFFGSSGRQTYSFAASGGTAVTLTVAGNLGYLNWVPGRQQLHLGQPNLAKLV